MGSPAKFPTIVSQATAAQSRKVSDTGSGDVQWVWGLRPEGHTALDKAAQNRLVEDGDPGAPETPSPPAPPARDLR